MRKRYGPLIGFMALLCVLSLAAVFLAVLVQGGLLDLSAVAITMGVLLLLGGILTVGLYRRGMGPLENLSDRARQLMSDNPSQPAPEKELDEIAMISRALSEIARKERHSRAELKQNREVQHAMASFFGDVIYEYDLDTDTISSSLNWTEKVSATRFLSRLEKEQVLYPADADSFYQYVERLKRGGIALTQDIRMRPAGEARYAWTRLCGTTLMDESGIPCKVIGKKMDIDREISEKEALLRKAQHDSLTGLYNSTAFASHVSDALQRDSHCKHLLFVFDIDNFKTINDTLGHLYGNAVLNQISARVSELFPAPSIVGRVGGDEFALFCRNIGSREALDEAAEMVLGVFRSYSGTAEEVRTITGSIGAAIFPLHGKNYAELFQKADDAMYYAKAHGKAQFVLYSDKVKEGHYLRRMEETAREAPQVSFNDNVSEYIFQILYESKDIETAVQLILDIVGRHYSVSRAYVFENTPDNLRTNNTFEWCASGISPQKENLQNYSYEEIGNYKNNFDDDGIFYCSDIETLENKEARELLRSQSIHSTLQCAIMDGDTFRGFVGFDECTGNRLWTKDEISALSFVAKILSTFLIRMRVQKQLEDAYTLTRTVLSHQNMMIYVVSFDSYELLFINTPTKNLVPEAKIGDICYERFMGRSSPCEFCPVRKLSESHVQHTMEIYNKMLDVWTNTTAAEITWIDGTKRCLLSCFDISGYKTGNPPS